MKALYGLYPDGESAQQAVNRLRASGVADGDIVVMSAQPMEEFDFGRRDRASWMWWFACLGGLLGMGAGAGLAWITETSWPLDVGGLPTYAWWPNLIIIFELTMLGVILATFISFVMSAGLGRRSRFYDSAVTDGKILVGVARPETSAISDLTSALSAVPGAEVKGVGSHDSRPPFHRATR
jgi:hypothetical protein